MTEPAVHLPSHTNVLADIADLAELLCDPHQHSEQILYWDANRNRKSRRHVTIQPGLLAQLYEAVIFPSAGAGDETNTRTAASRPPLALEALSLHTVITLAAAQWCWTLHVEQRDTVESNIRALVGRAATLDSDTARTLRADLRRWRTWCEVMTGWETVFSPKGVPCPVVECGQTGTLRILLAAKRAFCRNQTRDAYGELVCGATWTQDNIGVLADYIRSYTNAAARASTSEPA